MALAKEMMGGGLSALTARAINGQVNSAVSAAGTTQGTATAIKSGHNIVSTVGASSGVILPACEIGDEVFIYNGQVTNALTVYPDSGAAINQLAANTGVLLAPYTGVMFKRATSTAWTAFLSA